MNPVVSRLAWMGVAFAAVLFYRRLKAEEEAKSAE